MGKWHKGDKVVLSAKGRKYGTLSKHKDTIFVVQIEWSDDTIDLTYENGAPAYANIKKGLFKRLNKDIEQLMRLLYA
jgi:hypothetical protein